eukprot:2828002-Pleurochrysis_carterae.AAC.1
MVKRDLLAVVFVEHHVAVLAEADLNVILHHGLLDQGQVDVQVGHEQRVGELDDGAIRRDHNG